MQCLNPDIDIVFLSGATITGMRISLPNLTQYSCILLLVGTNDLTPKWVWLKYKHNMRKSNADFVLPSHSKTPVHRVTDDYKRLLKAIKLQNPSINILVSSIIPRPFDFDANKDYLISVNNALKDMARKPVDANTYQVTGR